jgi:hypothetical protein
MHSTSNEIQTLAKKQHDFDVCVVGGGMAGLCAAIASARNGARTCLIHDRPVLGGNASSEIRMWICGAAGENAPGTPGVPNDNNKEAGILEEIQLENCYRNPSLNYSVWDSVLYGKAFFQPNLTTLLNCSVVAAEMDGQRIASVTGWQLTTQTWHVVRATQFIDCSGDSILAPLSGAEFRTGRESRNEFNEDIQPAEADEKTMGSSLLIQLRRTDSPQPFIPPKWAFKFTSPEDFPHRLHGVSAHNFWWIELGGLKDTIADAEQIRDDLMRVVYGVWDYIKNRAPARDEAANWALEWIGSLPGKRENRRYVGDHILTQNDIRAGGAFDDIIAYGGWSMDDHHPAGMLYPGKPTIFHAAASPYGIPYRCLYSKNIANLLFAGRNISVTHAALSSTRVMATCSILGQAAGTAAALCVRHETSPRAVHASHLKELQSTLMDDDCWLPGLLRPISALAKSAAICADGEGLHRLLDGLDRDRAGVAHFWEGPLGKPIEFRWKNPVQIGGVRLIFDSHLNNQKRQPCSYPQKGDRSLVPKTLIKSFRIEISDERGQWKPACEESNNYQRLLRIPLNVKTNALRLIPLTTWGSETARIFAIEPMERFETKIPLVPEGPHFSQLVAQIPPRDLLPPQSGLETSDASRKRGISA